MKEDFIIAIIIGIIILFLFWSFALLFIYVRKPEKSKLTGKLLLRAFLVFFAGFVFLGFFVLFDSYLFF